LVSPQVSWLFFKARAKRPPAPFYDGGERAEWQEDKKWCGTGRASNAEKQPTGRGPKGCVENGRAAALLVGYVLI
jgi:hypothetical protein